MLPAGFPCCGPVAGSDCTVPPVSRDQGREILRADDQLQSRTLRTLMLGLIPSGAAMSGSYAVAAVLGEELTGSEMLGGLAASCMTTGSALASLPLARIMAAYGRRPGLLVGYLSACAGAGLAMASALTGWYVLLVPGMLGVGFGNGANLAARFAAADLAPEDGRARAIGTLVWASTVGAVLGPTIGMGPARSLAGLLGATELAGPYLVAAVLFGVAALTIHVRLRPDPLVVAGGVGGGVGRSPDGLATALHSLATSGTGRLAVMSMVAGHVVMVAVMTMTPLHMRAGAHELEVIGLVISLHIIGMYACAPAVGWLADRMGARPVLASGGVLLFIGSEMAAHTPPEQSLGVFAGLFLIGLGWSFGLIASSALLVGEFDGPERVRVQGLADLSMTAAGGLAGIGSGVAVAFTDYPTLAHNSGLVGLLPTVTVLLVALAGRRRELRGT